MSSDTLTEDSGLVASTTNEQSSDKMLDDKLQIINDERESELMQDVHASDEFLLVENDDENEETEDDSDDEELDTFLNLMNKAEKKNEKRKLRKNNQFGGNKSDWRLVNLTENEEDSTTDTDDDDDFEETNKFMSLMDKAKQKNSMMQLKLVNGKMQMTRISNGYEGQLMYNAMQKKCEKVLNKSLPKPQPSKPPISSRNETLNESQPVDGHKNQAMVSISRLNHFEDEETIIQRRKEEYRRQTSLGLTPKLQKSKGKRKFGDRMTLAEASAEDFDDGQDYVNFLQDKLQGIKIKLIK